MWQCERGRGRARATLIPVTLALALQVQHLSRILYFLDSGVTVSRMARIKIMGAFKASTSSTYSLVAY